MQSCASDRSTATRACHLCQKGASAAAQQCHALLDFHSVKIYPEHSVRVTNSPVHYLHWRLCFSDAQILAAKVDSLPPTWVSKGGLHGKSLARCCRQRGPPGWRCPRRCAPRRGGSSRARCPGSPAGHPASWPRSLGCSTPCPCPAPSCAGRSSVVGISREVSIGGSAR